jgi:hypothetical protein
MHFDCWMIFKIPFYMFWRNILAFSQEFLVMRQLGEFLHNNGLYLYRSIIVWDWFCFINFAHQYLHSVAVTESCRSYLHSVEKNKRIVWALYTPLPPYVAWLWSYTAVAPTMRQLLQHCDMKFSVICKHSILMSLQTLPQFQHCL